MTGWKRSVVHGLLVALTAWPVVHIGLVKARDLNPWKLAGWGMYAAPQLPAYARVFCLTSDDIGVYELSTVPPEVTPSLDAFLGRRRALRKLIRPDALAESLLGAYSAIDGVRIEVVQPVLDAKTGVIEERAVTYEYAR